MALFLILHTVCINAEKIIRNLVTLYIVQAIMQISCCVLNQIEKSASNVRSACYVILVARIAQKARAIQLKIHTTISDDLYISSYTMFLTNK